MNINIEVVNSPQICRNYPESIQREANRDYLLDTIDKMFEETSVVILEGEEGAGKTSLLAQFGKRNPNTTISCFIKPYSKFEYSPEHVRLVLAEQISWIVTKLYYNFDSIDSFNYNKLLFRLERMAINKGKPYVFMVDGIDDIPDEDKDDRNVILRELLPIGHNCIKFLFTGASTSKYSHLEGISKPWRVPPFGSPEVREYFADILHDPEQLEAVRRMCRGIPGHLSSVRRLLLAGKSIHEITESNPKTVPDFVKLEFKIFGTFSSRLSDILALLAFSFSRFSTKDISNLLGSELISIQNDISTCLLLQIDPVSEVVSFISNPHREFARTQFLEKKQWVIETIIEYLKGQEDNIVQLTELPTYFKQASRYDELLNQLTHDHLAQLVMRTETVSPLINQIDLGLNASMSLKRNLSYFNYAVLKSLSLELGGIETTYVEIESRLVLKEIGEAIALANSAVLKEDRLRMLSFIVKYTHEHSIKIDESLNAQISMLAKQIDFSAPGSDATIVASNLIWSDPDLAVSILDKATENRSDRDLAFIQLTMMTQAKEPMQGGNDHLLKKTISKIHDPEMQDFMSRSKVFFGKCGSLEVIDRLKGSEFRTKLFCLRNWAKTARFCNNPEVVLNYALDEIVKNTAYLPKLKDLCDLARQLPNINNEVESKHIVTRFDSMVASIEDYACSQDNTNIQILIAKAEREYDEKAYSDRLIDLYFEVIKISDLAVKAECLAIVKVALAELDPLGILEQKEQIQSCIDEELDKSVSLLLEGSADHFLIFKGTIGILAPNYPNKAMEIISKMNTSSRRDQGFYELANGTLKCSISNIDFSLLKIIINKVVNEEAKWQLIIRIFGKLVAEKDEISESQSSVLQGFVTLINDICSASMRCNAACLAYTLFKTSNTIKNDDICKKLELIVQESFKSIICAWERIEAGNRIAINFALTDSEKAKQYLLLCEKIPLSNSIDTNKSVDIHMRILLLAIRSFTGLFSNDETKDQYSILEHLIERIPSSGEQIGLWANLALLGYASGKKEFGDLLVNKHIWPNLDGFNQLEGSYKSEIIKKIAPALFYYHKSMALECISTLSGENQDMALHQICDYILTKTVWSEPYDARLNTGFKIVYTEAIDICDIVERMKIDVYLYSAITNLVESMVSKNGKYNITDIQRVAVKDRLSRIVQSKLPDFNNIKHEGFKIICEAQVMRLDKKSQSDWKKLVQRAKLIPNLSDRAYIYTILACCIPSGLADLKNDCVKGALFETERIPTDLDKIDRYIHIAEQLQLFDEQSARLALRFAMQVSASSEDPEAVHLKQRKIVDQANRLSPEFAEELANIFDCDPARMKARIDSLTEEPARIKARFDLHEYLKMLKAKNDIINMKQTPNKTELNDYQLPEITWKALASLNADLVTPCRIEESLEYLTVASRLPLTQSYPIYMWFVANLTKRLKTAPEVFSMIDPIFKSLVAVDNFTFRVHSKEKNQIKRLRESYGSESVGAGEHVIDSNDHDEVIQFMSTWLSKELKDYLYICDPYFTSDELEFIKMVGAVNRDCSVYILAGENKKDHTQSYMDYQLAWKKISDEEPPPTEIIYATIESGKSAFHDRCWLTNGAGLSLGTSLNGIGSPRVSHISIMEAKDYKKWDEDIRFFIERRRNFKGKIIKYYSFSL